MGVVGAGAGAGTGTGAGVGEGTGTGAATGGLAPGAGTLSPPPPPQAQHATAIQACSSERGRRGIGIAGLQGVSTSVLTLSGGSDSCSAFFWLSVIGAAACGCELAAVSA